MSQSLQLLDLKTVEQGLVQITTKEPVVNTFFLYYFFQFLYMVYRGWLRNVCTKNRHQTKVLHFLQRNVDYFYFKILFEREGEEVRQKDIPTHWFSLKMSATSRAGQYEAMNKELSSSFLCGWKHLSHLLLLPQVCISKKLKLKYRMWVS